LPVDLFLSEQKKLPSCNRRLLKGMKGGEVFNPRIKAENQHRGKSFNDAPKVALKGGEIHES